MRVESGLIVRIEEGRYNADGIPQWFPSGTINLTPYVPAIANQHSWCLVGITNAGTVLAQNGCLLLLRIANLFGFEGKLSLWIKTCLARCSPILRLV